MEGRAVVWMQFHVAGSCTGDEAAQKLVMGALSAGERSGPRQEV